MKNKKKWFVFGLLVLVMIVAGTAVYADITATYTLSKSVIGSGGGAVASGSYSLNGTVGQSVANSATNGGSYTLASGFWDGGSSGYSVYLPMIIK
jgi:hypothetical protein